MIKSFLKKSWLGLLSLAISFGFLYAGAAKSGGVSEIRAASKDVDLRWVAAGFFCVVMFWLLDGYVLYILTRIKYGRYRLLKSIKTGMVGLLYSALTPLSLGGQPMQIIDMLDEHVDAGNASSIITARTLVYQSTMTVFGVVSVLAMYGTFSKAIAHFSLFAVFGVVTNTAFIAAIALICVSERATLRLTAFFVNLLANIGIIRQRDYRLEKITAQIRLFHQSYSLIYRHCRQLAFSVVITFFQLVFYFLVPFCIYMGFDAGMHVASLTVFQGVAAASIIMMVTAFIPLPGAVGAAEGSFFLFFSLFFNQSVIIPAIFIWRILTYYSCIVVGALISLADILLKKARHTDIKAEVRH